MNRLISCILIVAIFATNLIPTARAQVWDELPPVGYEGPRITGDIADITFLPELTVYVPPTFTGPTTPPSEGSAQFVFSDGAGSIFSVNANFDTGFYTVVDQNGAFGAGTMNTEQKNAFREVAADLSLPAAERRLQCAGALGIICTIVITALVFALEGVRENMADQAECQRSMARDNAHALASAMQTCASSFVRDDGRQCLETPNFSDPNPDMCIGKVFQGCTLRCN